MEPITAKHLTGAPNKVPTPATPSTDSHGVAASTAVLRGELRQTEQVRIAKAEDPREALEKRYDELLSLAADRKITQTRADMRSSELTLGEAADSFIQYTHQALVSACKQEDLEGVRFWISKGATPGPASLGEACRKANPEILNILLQSPSEMGIKLDTTKWSDAIFGAYFKNTYGHEVTASAKTLDGVGKKDTLTRALRAKNIDPSEFLRAFEEGKENPYDRAMLVELAEAVHQNMDIAWLGANDKHSFLEDESAANIICRYSNAPNASKARALDVLIQRGLDKELQAGHLGNTVLMAAASNPKTDLAFFASLKKLGFVENPGKEQVIRHDMRDSDYNWHHEHRSAASLALGQKNYELARAILAEVRPDLFGQ